MNIYQYLKNQFRPTKGATIPAAQLPPIIKSEAAAEFVNKFGVISSDLRQILQDQSLVLYERSQIYQTIDRSLVHPLMSAATSIFADCATVRSPLHDSTVWVTSDSKEYSYQIEKMFDIINLEEVIYDWAWSIATFGDHFVQMYGEPGVGLVSINDDNHPVNISRVDYSGRLVGFYETPLGYSVADERKLMTPWDYCHFRLLGAKRRRPVYADPQYSEFRTISIMTPDVRRLTSKYGQSVLADALPIYKRLRLAEDSILMARISRGILRYIYKVAVEGNNNEAIAKIIDNYVDELKRARAMNTDPNNPNYVDKYQAMAGLEDIIMPVWKDVNSVAVEKIGGEVDIRWITDVAELIKQLSTALKVPLPLLAGYADQAPPAMGQGSIERLDIRFARQSRRIQRSMINGLTRMAQVHLAYQGMDPDLNLFQIQMAETSSAEEEELKNALDTGVDVAVKLADLWEKMIGPDADKKEILDYLNKKLLKLNDADLDKFIRKANPNAFQQGERTEELVPEVETPEKKEASAFNPFRESITVSDLKSALPKTVKEIKINETNTIRVGANTDWEANWGSKIVKIEPVMVKEEK